MHIAIITGASSGLGRAFFRRLVEKNPGLDRIWLIARRGERLAVMAEECPLPTEVLSLDLTKDSSFDTLEARLAAERPRVQLLINNAGVGELADMAASDRPTQTRMVDLNCRAVTAMIMAVLPYMGSGCGIVNIASIAAFAPNARMTVYSSTKAYVLSLSKGLRLELKPRGIQVLAVCPGPMATEFLEVAGITGQSKTFERLPYCNPERVVNGTLRALKRGRGIYTPRLFFKFYRLVAKLLPHELVMRWSRV